MSKVVVPPAGRGPSGSTFDRLTGVARHLVATGFTTRSRPGAWISEDGKDWTPMRLVRPPGGRLDLTATNRDVLVAFNSGGLCDFYRWHQPRKT